MTKLTKTLIDNYIKSQGTSRDTITEFVVPDHLNEIDTSIYKSFLPNLFPKNTTTKIGFSAFYQFSALRSICIPDSVTKIDSLAFLGCTSLTHIIWNNPNAGPLRNPQHFPTNNEHLNIEGGYEQYVDNTNVEMNTSFFSPASESQNQMQIITPTDYLKQNHHDLLEAIKDSEFNTDHVSNKELNIIMKLPQEDYLPNWKTLATSFKDRSMDQIKAILDYFGKTHCMPNTENSISFEQQDKIPAVVEGISMFLNPIEYTNLSMTAKEVILISQEHEELDQEDDSTSFCSIQ